MGKYTIFFGICESADYSKLGPIVVVLVEVEVEVEVLVYSISVGEVVDGGGGLLSIGISESADTRMPSGATMRFPRVVAWDWCFKSYCIALQSLA